MTDQRPEPLVPIDTDIGGLDSFMLNVDRLMTSELWALSSGDEFKAALALWCRAWKQSPPGSLPNDERVLAAFSGAGKGWRRVRDMALRGFVECSDGRLYHKVLCEDVARAATKKAERRERTKAATEARKRERDAQRNDERNVQRDDPPDDDATTDVTTSHRRDRDGTKEERKSSEAIASGASPPLDPKRVVFGQCLDWLTETTQKPKETLRSLLGKWVKDHGAGATIDAVSAAQTQGVIEPVAWIERRFSAAGRNGTAPAAAPQQPKLTNAQRQAELLERERAAR